jgi:hypothetical protein
MRFYLSIGLEEVVAEEREQMEEDRKGKTTRSWASKKLLLPGVFLLSHNAALLGDVPRKKVFAKAGFCPCEHFFLEL